MISWLQLITKPQQLIVCWSALSVVLICAAGNITQGCPPDFYFTPTAGTNCTRCGENSNSPPGGDRDQCICKDGFTRDEKDKSDPSKPCKEVDSTNWKVILIAFFIPTACIILISIVVQRLRIERLKTRMRQSQSQGDNAPTRVPKIHVVVCEDLNRYSTTSDANNVKTKDQNSVVRKTGPKAVGNSSNNYKRPRDHCQKPQERKTSTISFVKEVDQVYVNVDMYEIPRENVVLERPIGEGCFGLVYKGVVQDLPVEHHTNVVAVKTIRDDMLQYDEDFLHELQILRSITELHKNVIKLLACCTNNGPSLVILEYLAKGDLLNYLKMGVQNSSKKQGVSIIPRIQKLEFCRHIADGMVHLGKQNIIHRDLACRNVLLSANLEPKISDFGLARNKSLDGTYIKGLRMAKLPIMWMAPESIFQRLYSTKSDVWSFGVVLWEIFQNGDRPYPGFTIEEIPTVIKSKYRMERPAECNNALYKIMTDCWSEDPDDRPSFEILQGLKEWAFSEPIAV